MAIDLGSGRDPQTIIVVPSISADLPDDVSGAEVQALEERYLFLLFLLRQPRARLLYITSQTIQPAVIDYYLDLLPGVVPSHARARLFMLAPMDSSPVPLAQKLLERPGMLEKIRSLVPDPDRAHIVPYIVTELERDLALALGIPIYGADPRFSDFGTKSGCRKLFAELGVPLARGAEDLRAEDEIVGAVAELRRQNPELQSAMVKLNTGLSGLGNAVVDLAGLPGQGDGDGLIERVRGMAFESSMQRYDHYMNELAAKGGVVEERLSGQEFRSPSVQLRVTPFGALEILSTHDQLLGGPSGGLYLGCVFPADPAYAPAITAEARKIGMRMAQEGVIGRFAVDFVVVRSEGADWVPYAIEINLRKGGTTHPFLTLQFLTDGGYNPETAEYLAPDGQRKCIVASDHVESASFRGLTPDDVFDIVVRNGLHFNLRTQTGVVLHMLSALGERGQMGMTAVANSPAEAQALYERAVAVFESEAAGLYQPHPRQAEVPLS